MRVNIVIPNLGESITEVTIGALLKQNGAYVRAGDELLELETDKLNQPLYAPSDGTLQLSVRSGEKVSVGSVVGVIRTDQAELVSPQNSEQQESKQAGMVVQVEVPQVVSSSVEVSSGVGKYGAGKYDAPKYVKKAVTSVRKSIATRLLKAQQQAVMLTTFNEVDMSKVIQLREEFKEEFQKRHEVKLGFMSFFVKAATIALQLFPNVNSFIDGDQWIFNQFYDIGVAVASERGLVVPVIRGCEHLSFAQVEKSIAEYVKKANKGQLTLDEMSGASFTITNGGVFGSLLSTPILNPPQAAILGMHTIQKRAVVINDQIVIRPMMYIALTYDHTVLDGQDAVLFLKAIKEHIEEPERLLFEI